MDKNSHFSLEETDDNVRLYHHNSNKGTVSTLMIKKETNELFAYLSGLWKGEDVKLTPHAMRFASDDLLIDTMKLRGLSMDNKSSISMDDVRKLRAFKVNRGYRSRPLKIQFFYDPERGQTICAISDTKQYFACGVANLNPNEIDTHNNLEGAKVALMKSLDDSNLCREDRQLVWNEFFKKYPEAKR